MHSGESLPKTSVIKFLKDEIRIRREAEKKQGGGPRVQEAITYETILNFLPEGFDLELSKEALHDVEIAVSSQTGKEAPQTIAMDVAMLLMLRKAHEANN